MQWTPPASVLAPGRRPERRALPDRTGPTRRPAAILLPRCPVFRRGRARIHDRRGLLPDHAARGERLHARKQTGKYSPTRRADSRAQKIDARKAFVRGRDKARTPGFWYADDTPRLSP